MLKEEYIEYVEENIKVAKRKYKKEKEMLPGQSVSLIYWQLFGG